MSFDIDFKKLTVSDPNFIVDTEEEEEDINMELDSICDNLKNPWLIHSPEQEMNDVLRRYDIIQNYLENLKKNTNIILFEDIVKFIYDIRSRHFYYLDKIVFTTEEELDIKSLFNESILLINNFDSTPLFAIKVLEFLEKLYDRLFEFIDRS